MLDGKYNNLQETLEEGNEDDNMVFEEETLILYVEIERDNVMHVTYEDVDENEVDAYMSDQDCDLDGNAYDNYDDLSL